MGNRQSIVATIKGYGWNCFMNAVLQSFISCPSTKQFLSDIHNSTKHLPSSNYPIFASIWAIHSEIIDWQQKNRPINPNAFIFQFFKHQHDSSIKDGHPGDPTTFFFSLATQCDQELKDNGLNPLFSDLFKITIGRKMQCTFQNCPGFDSTFSEYFIQINPSAPTVEQAILDFSQPYASICAQPNHGPSTISPYTKMLPKVLCCKISSINHSGFPHISDSIQMSTKETFDSLPNEAISYYLQAIVISFASHAVAIIKKDSEWYLTDDESSRKCQLTEISNGKFQNRRMSAVLLFYEVVTPVPQPNIP